jgi:VWFA-related protein
VLYFDMTAMGPTEQRRALESAQKFIQTEMTPSDLISIVRYGGAAVEVLQDFTDDRQRLLRILETLKVGEGQDYAEGSDSAGAGDSGAAFGQDDGEFNVFNTNRQLAALQNAVEMLAHLSEKKSFIYFAGGIRMSGTANLSQLRATIDSAIRAGVSFWPVDARGLVAAPPMGDAAQASPGGIEMYTGAAIMAQTATFQQSQDTLYALASDTGGKAMLDSNDLTTTTSSAITPLTRRRTENSATSASLAPTAPRRPSIIARATMLASSSTNSPPPTRSSSSKRP